MGASKGTNNGGGRRAKPASLIDNTKDRISNETLARRMEAEKNITPKTADIFTPPKGLTALAKKEWQRVVALYQELDLDYQFLCDLDIAMLRSYCEAVATQQLAQASIEAARKEAKRNHKVFYMESCEFEYKQIEKCTKIISSLSNHLGLSPSSRAGLGIFIAGQQAQKKPKEKTELDDFFDEE